MLHGNPTWSFFYRNLVIALRDRYRVIVPDHLGCGFSDKPASYPYRLANHIDNIELLLNRLEVGNHSLVVHDWGGAIGMGYAGRRPERIQSLVILNTAAFPAERIPFRIGICRVPGLGALLVRGLNLFVLGALRMAVTNPLSPAVRQGYRLPYSRWENRVAILRFIQDIPLGPSHPSWAALLEAEAAIERFRENTPALLFWGGRDFCFNDRFFAEWQQRLPHAKSIYLPDAGHYVLEDAGERAALDIGGFLDSSAR